MEGLRELCTKPVCDAFLGTWEQYDTKGLTMKLKASCGPRSHRFSGRSCAPRVPCAVCESVRLWLVDTFGLTEAAQALRPRLQRSSAVSVLERAAGFLSPACFMSFVDLRASSAWCRYLSAHPMRADTRLCKRVRTDAGGYERMQTDTKECDGHARMLSDTKECGRA